MQSKTYHFARNQQAIPVSFVLFFRPLTIHNSPLPTENKFRIGPKAVKYYMSLLLSPDLISELLKFLFREVIFGQVVCRQLRRQLLSNIFFKLFFRQLGYV